MKTIRAVILALLWCSIGWLDAAPSITGVTWTSDTTVVITGTGFTSKSPAKPLLWADFATDINPSSLGTRTEWDVIQSLTHTSDLPVGAGTSNGVYGQWGNAAWSHSFSVAMTAPNYYSKIFTWGKRYYTFPTTTNQKVWRLNPPGDCGLGDGCGDPVFNYSSGANDWFAHLNECDSDNPDRFTNEGGYTHYTEDTWQTEEVIWQYKGGSGRYYNNNPALDSGIVAYWINGVRIFRQESWENCSTAYVDLRMFDNFTPQNTPTDTPAPGERVYMTYLYADTVYNHVIIGSHATLAESTERMICIITEWAQTSISAIVVRGTFDIGDSAHLFAYDSLDSASSGYGTKIGGGETDTPYHASAVDTVWSTSHNQGRDTTGWIVSSGKWSANHYFWRKYGGSRTWVDSVIGLGPGVRDTVFIRSGGDSSGYFGTTGRRPANP